MSLNLDNMVKVSIQSLTGGLTRREFGIGNLVTTSEVLGVGNDRLGVYASIDDVLKDFDTSSTEYKAAQVWFSQVPAAKNLIISRRFDKDYTGTILGISPEYDLSAWKAVTNASITLTVDGVVKNLTGLTFADANTLSDVASVINTAAKAVFSTSITSYNSMASRFEFDSGKVCEVDVGPGEVGDDESVDISDMLGWGEDARRSPGVASETLEESLDNIAHLNDSWVFLFFTPEVYDTELATNAAEWVEAREYLFANLTTDINSKAIGDTNNKGHELTKLSRKKTWSTYSSAEDYKNVSSAARISSINFDQSNSLITLKFKELPGIVTDSFSQSAKTALDEKRINYYTDFAGASIYAEGTTHADKIFVDAQYGLMWLKNALQIDIFNLLANSGKISQTEAGIAALRNSIRGVLLQAVRNGLLAAGEVSDAMQNDISQTTGQAFDGYLPEGFLIYNEPLAGQSQSDRDARKAPPFKVWAKGSGAVHFVDITVIFEN